MDREFSGRKLRFAGIALCAVVATALSVMWFRSYIYAEQFQGWISHDRCFLIASKQGRVTLISFPPAFHPNHWRWEHRRFGINSNLAFPTPDTQIDEWGLGFGRLRDPYYSLEMLFYRTSDVPSPSSSNPKLALISLQSVRSPLVFAYADFVTFRGTGLVVPYWSLVAWAAANATLLWINRPPRFSMRTMFLAFTAIATLLGVMLIMNN